MENVKEILQTIGLGKNKAEIYLSLLAKGKSSVMSISKNTGIHRANVNDSLNSLVNLGLVSYLNIEEKKYFIANDPDSLRLLIKQKEEKLNSIFQQLKSYPEKTENKAQFFEGIEGIKKVMEDMLLIGEKIQTYGIPESVSVILGGYIDDYHKRRINARISIQHIYNENAKERIDFLNKLPFTEAKYLPSEYNAPTTTVIYGNKVAFWIWSKIQFVVLIESEKMAKTYKKYFDLLWGMAK